MSGSAIRDISSPDVSATDALRARLQRLKEALAREGGQEPLPGAPLAAGADARQRRQPVAGARDGGTAADSPARTSRQDRQRQTGMARDGASVAAEIYAAEASATIFGNVETAQPVPPASDLRDAGEREKEERQAALSTQGVASPEVADGASDALEAVRAGAKDLPAEAERTDPLQMARLLLGMVSQPPSVISLQEKQLAQDLLAVLLSGGELAQAEEICAQVVDRLCHMQPPPVALLRVVLECAGEEGRQRLGEELRVGEDTLLQLLQQADGALMAGMLRRRHIPGVVVQQLLEAAPDELVPVLLDNEGAVLNEVSWWMLLQRVADNPKLSAPMLARADMPRHVALELFWHLTGRQRRLFLLRHAGESQELKKLLALAMPQATLEKVGKRFLAEFHVMLGLLAEGDRLGAAQVLARHCGLQAETVMRILRDAQGEPLGVLFKACGVSTASLREVIRDMQGHRKAHYWPWLNNPDHVLEVHSLLGVSRARMMLLYWDWRSRAVGPYRDFPPLGN